VGVAAPRRGTESTHLSVLAKPLRTTARWGSPHAARQLNLKGERSWPFEAHSAASRMLPKEAGSSHKGQPGYRFRGDERRRDAGSWTSSTVGGIVTRRRIPVSTEPALRVEAELNRLLNLYATGEIDAEWLTTHVRDREGRIGNLKLLISAVESDITSREQDRLAAAQTETWLRKLADNLAEVEGDSIEAFQKRRELVQLLEDHRRPRRGRPSESGDYLPIRPAACGVVCSICAEFRT
jgi:hypothetical protein